MPRKVEPDFWLYSFQFEESDWIDSISGKPRELPPVEQHKREWCQCPLCKPERYAKRNHRTNPSKSRR
jgi:hypothetical protein